MNLSRKWLSEFVDLSLEEKNDREFAEAMTMSGSKVEGTHYMGEGISNVVVGKIEQMDLLWGRRGQRQAHPVELQGRRGRRQAAQDSDRRAEPEGGRPRARGARRRHAARRR